MTESFDQWERKAFAAFQEITKDMPRKKLVIDASKLGNIIMNGYAEGKSPEEVAMEYAIEAGIVSMDNIQ